MTSKKQSNNSAAESDDINADIAEAISQLESSEVEEPEAGEVAPAEVIAEEPETEPAAELAQDEKPEEQQKDSTPAPQSWSKEAKSEWAKVPESIRAEVAKREMDIHQMVTRHDGELRLGREIKDIVTPYMPLIQAAGSTPANTINGLLNTAYQLQTGTADARKNIIRQIAKDYGVDLADIGAEQEYTDPTIAQLQREIESLKQAANPVALKSQLQEEMESAKINAEVQAFASDPANVHYQAVKGIMASLLGNGQAANLKEAYDMACYASPQIRSTLEAKARAEQEAKRKAELAKKKHASASITGSPAISNSSAKKPQSTGYTDPTDDLRAAFAELESRA